MFIGEKANPTLTAALTWREVDPAEVGMSREGVREINEVFEELFVEGLHSAAQLVVLRHGRVVLDRTLGVTKLGTTHSVKPSTPFMTFSCTKPLIAMCIHKLVEDGVVELDAPVAAYWSEYGVRGKEATTIRQVLLHQAGIPAKGLYWQIPRWWDWAKVTAHVAASAAEFEPGRKTAYHLVNFGFILGEVLCRVTGMAVDEYMRQELFGPLGMANAYLGLPAAEGGRAAEIYWGAADQRNAVLLFRRARSAVMPAATLNCSARDLAIFYQMLVNGGRYGGYQFVKPQTVAQAIAIGSEGWDETLGIFMRWGMGFGLGGPRPAHDIYGNRSSLGRRSTISTFGHAGQRSSIAWADMEQQVVLAFTCNGLVSEADNLRRQESLADALWDALA